MNVNLKIIDCRLKENLPQYATSGSAGLDLLACIDEPLTLRPNETYLMNAGISIHLDDPGYAAMIIPRSGLGHKNGIVTGNMVGLIDSDYQGELKISLWNRSQTDYTIKPLDRVAQLVIVPVIQAKFNIVESFNESKRGEGGFGSTGKN